MPKKKVHFAEGLNITYEAPVGDVAASDSDVDSSGGVGGLPFNSNVAGVEHQGEAGSYGIAGSSSCIVIGERSESGGMNIGEVVGDQTSASGGVDMELSTATRLTVVALQS